MAMDSPSTFTELAGVQYVTDATGRRTAVIISLEEWGEVWEDFCDVLIAESRSGEARRPWEEIKADLDVDHDRSG